MDFICTYAGKEPGEPRRWQLQTGKTLYTKSMPLLDAIAIVNRDIKPGDRYIERENDSEITEDYEAFKIDALKTALFDQGIDWENLERQIGRPLDMRDVQDELTD